MRLQEMKELVLTEARMLHSSSKGSVIQAVMMVPISILVLMIAFTILDPILKITFNVIDNSSVIAYGGTIKVLLGIVGLILVALVILAIFNEFRTREQYVG